jgi:hypothetical protein
MPAVHWGFRVPSKRQGSGATYTSVCPTTFLFDCSSSATSSASLQVGLAPQNPTGNPWVHATNGSASQPGRHPDSQAQLKPLTVSESPGQNDPIAQNMNVCLCHLFSHTLHRRSTETARSYSIHRKS